MKPRFFFARPVGWRPLVHVLSGSRVGALLEASLETTPGTVFTNKFGKCTIKPYVCIYICIYKGCFLPLFLIEMSKYLGLIYNHIFFLNRKIVSVNAKREPFGQFGLGDWPEGMTVRINNEG